MIKAVLITLVSNPTSAILDRPAGVFRTHNEMNHREILSHIDLHKKVTPDRYRRVQAPPQGNRTWVRAERSLFLPWNQYVLTSRRRGDVFTGWTCGFPFYSGFISGSSSCHCSVKLQGRNISLNLITSNFRNVRSVTSKEAPMQTKVVNPSRHAWQGATKTVPVSTIFYKTLNREDHLLLLL
jgi:hypothetical protein